MIVRPYIPPPQPPFRGFYKSDEAYQEALSKHEQLMERYHEDSKTDDAIMILFASVLILMMLAIFCFTAWFAGGIRGLAYLFSVSGLLWVAFIQIRRRL